MSSDSVIIGKNIIEILTTGMYHNPLVIFREYVQNSVDAINEAVSRGILEDVSEGYVQIVVDKEKKRIFFEDNGVGVSRKNAWQILTSIAASGKDRTKNLGFRGIGRLAGLAYCDELIIETSFKGEATKTVLQWDGQKLKEIIADKKDRKRASEVIEAITAIDDGVMEQEGEHYFKVTLEEVKNTKLLDVDEVERYLRMVAPVDFCSPKLILTPKIKEGLIKKGISPKSYRVFVNESQLFKSYRGGVYKEAKKQEKRLDDVIDIRFFDLYSIENKLLAVGWYTLTKNMQLIPVVNEARGIRFRKGNIQVGDEVTLQRFFQDKRFHHYFFGEIHVVHEELFPNGQRDYFDECELLSEFEAELDELTNKLHKLCRKASDWNRFEKQVSAYAIGKEKYNDLLKTTGFYGPNHEKEEKSKLDLLEEAAKQAQKELERIKKYAEDDEDLKRFIEYRLGEKIVPSHENREKEKRNSLEIAGEQLQKHPKNVEKDTKASEPVKCSPGQVNYSEPDANKQEKKEQAHKKIPSKKNGRKYITSGLTKLTKKEQKIVGEILEISRIILPPDLQQNLFAKIEERFKLTKFHE
ncbi:MAG: ATP-binding protein [Candidatus Electrothrix aestuarii]|uniref:ATP-binding protein n=1 Tax=Candidatus Electrothrix aestuarii TaxID=3062594 RepID=A0AAU8LYL7_9BACT|nr:ATP-binding protein [Candidatus Electrothrix aestuarii]